MTLPAPIADAFRRQAEACRDLGSPLNALVCDLLCDRLTDAGAFGGRIHRWPGEPVAEALALRSCGGLHALARSGRCPALTEVYPPATASPEAMRRGIAAALAGHDGFLAGYLDSPPQTNEVARSGLLLGGCLAIAGATGLPLEILEIGSSAGLNLGFDRYHYDLGDGRTWGDAASPVTIRTCWEGGGPADAILRIAGREGCDRNPLDPASAADRERLLSYVWPDQIERLARIDAALAVAADAGWTVARADAADWVENRFARPAAGRVRVLMHTIVWQYLPAEVQRRIEAALDTAGAAATAEAPIAWLRVEPDGLPGSAGIRLTLWPGGETRLLGRADYHGRWARWAP